MTERDRGWRRDKKKKDAKHEENRKYRVEGSSRQDDICNCQLCKKGMNCGKKGNSEDFE